LIRVAPMERNLVATGQVLDIISPAFIYVDKDVKPTYHGSCTCVALSYPLANANRNVDACCMCNLPYGDIVSRLDKFSFCETNTMLLYDLLRQCLRDCGRGLEGTQDGGKGGITQLGVKPLNLSV
jgi:hypothetical protein